MDVADWSMVEVKSRLDDADDPARPATYINESEDTLLLPSESKALMVRRPEGVSGSVAMAMCWDGYGVQPGISTLLPLFRFSCNKYQEGDGGEEGTGTLDYRLRTWYAFGLSTLPCMDYQSPLEI
ncbi:hypothetical protein HZH68_011924 [Vespula germanica]|uniref:Uncharacterized protein n=1 Tax=Vespula germanica TaxID=30212 RepID=A0A834JL42_VESGE|nr:hypothetical protein HZH68_011924 [Vespula germanica]